MCRLLRQREEYNSEQERDRVEREKVKPRIRRRVRPEDFDVQDSCADDEDLSCEEAAQPRRRNVERDFEQRDFGRRDFEQRDFARRDFAQRDTGPRKTSRGEGCQCPCCHAHRDFAQRPQPPVSRPRPYPPRCVDSAYPAPFDECCPYCTNLERQRPMLYHDEYSNRNRDRRDFSTVAMGPGGFMPTLAGPGSEVLQTRLPQGAGEKLPEDQSHTFNRNWRLFYADDAVDPHVVVCIDKTLIECRPKAQPHMFESPLADWKKEPFHRDMLHVGDENPDLEDCYVAYSNQRPMTHVWCDGIALHFDGLVKLTFTKSADNGKKQDRKKSSR